ncbi:MAG: hypothetical protein V4696_01870, partial [Pseudomonadota bacterium]
MRYSLASMWRRARNPRRREVVFRPIVVPSTKASDLYASVYAPVIRIWTEAATAILAEYERSLAEITTDAAPDIGARIDMVERDLLSVLVTLRGRIGEWSRIVESWHRRAWKQRVLSATGIDLGTMLGPGDVRTTLEAVIERNVGLVKSVSAEARTRIGESVYRGLRERKPAREVAKEIREATGMARRRALRIAAHQNTALASELQDERRRQAGIETWEWVHSDKTN